MECDSSPTTENQHKNMNCLGEKMETQNISTIKGDVSSISSMTKSISSLVIYDSVEMSWNSPEGKVDGLNGSQVDSTSASQISARTDSCYFNAKVLAACQPTEYAKTCEKGCLRKVLKKDTQAGTHTTAPLENKPCFSEDSSITDDRNIVLHPSRKFIASHEWFEDDLLEDFECSDVVTEEACQDYEAKLRFLLESDGEGDELIPSSNCDGCAYFLSEMPRLFQVSDNTMPIDATIGFCGHQSKSKEVAVRNNLTAYRPSTLQTGMTLLVGQEQSKTPSMKNKEKCKQSVDSMAIKKIYSRKEDHRGNNASVDDISVLRPQGIENGISVMKSSSRNLGVSSEIAGQQGIVDRVFSRKNKNSQQVTPVEKKMMEGTSRLTNSSKDPPRVAPAEEPHSSKLCKVQMNRNDLDSAALLHRQRETLGKPGLVSATIQDGLFHGQGRVPLSGKWITGLSEENQASGENTLLKTEEQEIDTETSASISNDSKLFITDPALDKRLACTPCCLKNFSGVAENSTLRKVNGNAGSQRDVVSLENPASFYGSDGTQEAELSWTQTPCIARMDDTSHNDVPPKRPDCPSALSQKGLCDILTPVAMLNVQMEKASIGKPYEVNKVKTDYDTPNVQHQSKVNFPSLLESAEPEDGDTDLSSVHKQLQNLIYEEDWDNALTCAGSEVKSLAAGIDTAKEVRGLNITGDVSGRQPVPGNSKEDNQCVSKLATAMKVHSDFSSLLKTDETHSCTSKVNSPAIPEETNFMCLHSAFGHKREKASVQLLRSNFPKGNYSDNQSETQCDHSGSIQMTANQEATVITDKAFQCCEQGSPFRFTEVPDNTLEHSQEISLEQLPDNLGQSSHLEQNVLCRDGHRAKQANEIPTEERPVLLCHPKIKECANFTECSWEEDSSSNFSGKHMDQLTDEEHFSIMTIDRNAEEEIQGKVRESELNAQRDKKCGIYPILRDNNSKGITVPDAQNYVYHIQEHDPVTDAVSKSPWKAIEETSQDKGSGGGYKLGPMFTASHKVSFFTEVLLEMNKNLKNSTSQKCKDFSSSIEPTILESKDILRLPPSNSQQLVSEESSAHAEHLCESVKGSDLDLVHSQTETNKLEHSNTVQSSSVISKECCGTGQNSQNDLIGNITTNKPKKVSKRCNSNILMVSEHLMQMEPMRTETEKNTDRKALKSWQDQYEGTKETPETEIFQAEKRREMFVVDDFEEAEIEPYMRALIDSEQIHLWHESHNEYQQVEKVSQSKIMPYEMDAKEIKKSVGDDLEEPEVEPYMRALINSEQIYSWHDYPDCMHPFTDFSNEQAAVPVAELERGCAVLPTSHSQSRAFTDDEKQNPSRHAVGMLGSSLPSASQKSYHFGKILPQVKFQPGSICAIESERITSQEASKIPKPSSLHKRADDMKPRQETVTKRILKVPIKKASLEAKENIGNNASCIKSISRTEADSTHKEVKGEQKLLCRKDSKAPKLLKKIQAELFPDFSGNIKLCCQFGEIYEDSTITWTKDSKLLARVHRSTRDDLPVSLAIVQVEKKDQGLYQCCLKNSYGKAATEFNLTSEVLEHLSSLQDIEGLEEIEFLQLMFREDFICDSYLSKSLHGRITTEQLHFGEGVHRKAFRSKVLQGLVPLFSPGHPCVLKVHNAITYGTKNNDELVKKNYKLALQECYVQNAAREYAKIYAAETQPLEGFGEVPEIIPIFLIHRPKNNIPYATVEEELIGEFVKYSVRDGKEINLMRRDSEAGQKCCTFQHWVYEKTSGGLLVTDMQGVGMKLTDVGIATLAKGYKGFKGNCSISFIDQFKVLHQCNKYCEMLGLKPLQSSCQKQRKPAVARIKAQSNPCIAKKTLVSAQATMKT